MDGKSGGKIGMFDFIDEGEMARRNWMRGEDE